MSALYTNRFKTVASTIAPDPLIVNYWIDLTADPNGKVIKYNNNGKWQTISSTDVDTKIAALESTVADLVTRVHALETPTA